MNKPPLAAEIDRLRAENCQLRKDVETYKLIDDNGDPVPAGRIGEHIEAIHADYKKRLAKLETRLKTVRRNRPAANHIEPETIYGWIEHLTDIIDYPQNSVGKAIHLRHLLQDCADQWSAALQTGEGE